MKQYHKIQGLFKRDPKTNKFIEGEWSMPEFGYLAELEWVWTEKVDGTNMRVMWDGETLKFGGKSDRAQLHGDLIDNMSKLFTTEKMKEFFPAVTPDIVEDNGICLYGEGYGPGIQKVGKEYRDDKSFVLFDIRVGHWWLKRDDVRKIAEDMGIEHVPEVQRCPIAPMIEIIRAGYTSAWNDFTAEGVVGTPLVPLAARSGERIITKIKTVDFT